jgi:hypothetical protein
MAAYDALLAEVRAMKQKYQKDLQPPASDAAVDGLRRAARAQLGADIPDQYAEFLRRTNGLEFNGFGIYATDKTPLVGNERAFTGAFVEANLTWRQNPNYRKYLIFAESGEYNYVLNTESGAYEVRTQPVDALDETAASFEELLVKAFEAHRP